MARQSRAQSMVLAFAAGAVTYAGGKGTMVAAHYPDGHVCVTLGR